MKQRLGLAIALIHDPGLIILDEPTNGLDPQGIADIRNLILRLSKEMRKTVLLSSHLLSEVELIANRMLIIHQGKKIAEGLVSSLLDPSQTIVEIETTDNPGSMSVIEKSTWKFKASIHKNHLEFQINRAEIPELVSSLNELGINIIAVRPRHSLENYFLSLTNENAHA